MTKLGNDIACSKYTSKFIADKTDEVSNIRTVKRHDISLREIFEEYWRK